MRSKTTRRGDQVVVAIDGPAGAGKSSVAAMVAQQLGYLWIDTGALYRGVALAASEQGISWEDEKRLDELCGKLDLTLRVDAQQGSRLLLAKQDRSADIRSQAISQGASQVARHPSVRGSLLHLQRQLGAAGGAVLEGRDIGTVVFPDAEVKIFLTAPVEVRARRRWRELVERGVQSDFTDLLHEISARDAQDESRALAPLVPASDAVVVDSGELSMLEVADRIVQTVRQRIADAVDTFSSDC